MRNVCKRGHVAVVALALLLSLAGCASSTASGAMTPTETPVLVHLPTATPIPTPADPTGQALERTAQSAVGSAARSVGVTYDPSAENLTVTLTITGELPISDAQIAAAYARVKTLSFQEMSRLWSSGLPLRKVSVIILGPVQDEYDTLIDQWYGIAVVNEASARKLSWASATPVSAWSAYDQTFLRQVFVLFDDVPSASPVPTATATH